ncbi:metallophosphoesterase family protein [Synechococcus sp. CS-1333]|uniref:metallophosphoesterase family protein n=1 Tax=Synechococcus sp. CS-1333 TaxID=2848638 RepID=UPI00223C41C9|nr:metallophosphoesterase family protein [Synechococcus sp. CS-1333]
MSSPDVVAIGDVHGCASLLEQELTPHLDSGVELIFLGDLIDRAPEPEGDRKVLERVWQLQDNTAAYGLSGVTLLRGNHEQMLLESLGESKAGTAYDRWRYNGGEPALLPLAGEHREWFEQLPVTAIRGGCLFVHAGVRPGVPLERQAFEDLIWIRKPFLSKPHGLPYTVVHGHTFRHDFQITHLPHRIGIDTGAYLSGRLTALRIETATNPCSPMDQSGQRGSTGINKDVDQICTETIDLTPERGHQTAAAKSTARPTTNSWSVREAGRSSVLVAAAFFGVALRGGAVASLGCGLHLHPKVAAGLQGINAGCQPQCLAQRVELSDGLQVD